MAEQESGSADASPVPPEQETVVDAIVGQVSNHQSAIVSEQSGNLGSSYDVTTASHTDGETSYEFTGCITQFISSGSAESFEADLQDRGDKSGEQLQDGVGKVGDEPPDDAEESAEGELSVSDEEPAEGEQEKQEGRAVQRFASTLVQDPSSSRFADVRDSETSNASELEKCDGGSDVESATSSYKDTPGEGEFADDKVNDSRGSESNVAASNADLSDPPSEIRNLDAVSDDQSKAGTESQLVDAASNVKTFQSTDGTNLSGVPSYGSFSNNQWGEASMMTLVNECVTEAECAAMEQALRMSRVSEVTSSREELEAEYHQHLVEELKKQKRASQGNPPQENYAAGLAPATSDKIVALAESKKSLSPVISEKSLPPMRAVSEQSLPPAVCDTILSPTRAISEKSLPPTPALSDKNLPPLVTEKSLPPVLVMSEKNLPPVVCEKSLPPIQPVSEKSLLSAVFESSAPASDLSRKSSSPERALPETSFPPVSVVSEKGHPPTASEKRVSLPSVVSERSITLAESVKSLELAASNKIFLPTEENPPPAEATSSLLSVKGKDKGVEATASEISIKSGISHEALSSMTSVIVQEVSTMVVGCRKHTIIPESNVEMEGIDEGFDEEEIHAVEELLNHPEENTTMEEETEPPYDDKISPEIATSIHMLGRRSTEPEDWLVEVVDQQNLERQIVMETKSLEWKHGEDEVEEMISERRKSKELQEKQERVVEMEESNSDVAKKKKQSSARQILALQKQSLISSEQLDADAQWRKSKSKTPPSTKVVIHSTNLQDERVKKVQMVKQGSAEQETDHILPNLHKQKKGSKAGLHDGWTEEQKVEAKQKKEKREMRKIERANKTEEEKAERIKLKREWSERRTVQQQGKNRSRTLPEVEEPRRGSNPDTLNALRDDHDLVHTRKAKSAKHKIQYFHPREFTNREALRDKRKDSFGEARHLEDKMPGKPHSGWTLSEEEAADERRPRNIMKYDRLTFYEQMQLVNRLHGSGIRNVKTTIREEVQRSASRHRDSFNQQQQERWRTVRLNSLCKHEYPAPELPEDKRWGTMTRGGKHMGHAANSYERQIMASKRLAMNKNHIRNETNFDSASRISSSCSIARKQRDSWNKRMDDKWRRSRFDPDCMHDDPRYEMKKNNDWGTMNRWGHHLGYKPMTPAKQREFCERLAKNKKCDTHPNPQRWWPDDHEPRRAPENKREETVKRLTRGGGRETPPDNKRIAEGRIKQMGIVNSYAWKGYN